MNPLPDDPWPPPPHNSKVIDVTPDGTVHIPVVFLPLMQSAAKAEKEMNPLINAIPGFFKKVIIFMLKWKFEEIDYHYGNFGIVNDCKSFVQC